MLVGADRRNAKRKVELAYNEPAGVTAAFILNGLNHCNALLGGGGGNDHGDGDANGNGNGNGDGNAAGGAALDPSAFEYAAWYNVEEGRHEAYYRSVRDQTLTLRHEGRETVVTLAAGELIHIEYSYKYGSAEVAELVEVSGLTHVRQWSDAAEQYDLHLLRNDGGGDKQQQQKKKEDGENGASAAAASSNSNPAITAPPSAAMPSLWSTSGSHYVCDLGGVDPTNQRAPAFSEFLDLWNAWDCVSLRMVPAGRHDDRPIKLRMPLMFYIGHIPAFDDFLVAAYAGAPRLEPQEYARIFERGIDPDVDSLQVHHRHSKVPSAYPPLDDVLRYRDAVRCALQRLYASYPGGTSTMPRRLQRVLWAAIEHEVMHLETYVYMLAQYDAVLPPPGAPPPPGAIPYAAASDAAAAGAGAAATTTTATSATSGNGNNAAAAAAALPPQPPAAGLIALGPSQVALGMDDPEAADFEPGAPRVEDGHLFGWDVEKPAATVNVAACRVQNRPVTVAEYYAFLSSRQQQQQAEEGGDAAAAATRALVPASWTACGASATGWAVRTVFGAVPLEHAWYWPVVCSLLLANAYADSVGMRVPSEGELMLMRREAAARGDLDVHTNNVSFRHWHPTPTDVDSPGKIVDIVGQAWEWTSTPFAPLAPGYSPSVIYPDYSVDFFDGKHNVILGGSWATHHRWAQRACVRNWYQHNYPYVFAKFRLAEK